ncbi:MAG TPA: glycosyltransferase [Chitinophagaceae bacterium]|nr:glycosyltransferase [Chitinophagaceae bacterium]
MIEHKTRIAIVIPTLDKGGAERVLVNLVNHVDYSKYGITILCLKKRGGLVEQVNKEVEIIDLDQPRAYLSIPRINKELKRIKPAVVIGWMGDINAILAFLRRMLPKGIPVMCRESSIPTLNFDTYHYPGVFKYMYRSYKWFDGIICQSEAMKADLVENFDVNPESVRVISNPVVEPPAGSFLPDEQVNFIGKDTKLLVFVGRFNKEKQVEQLLDTMPLLAPHYRLLLIGYGMLEETIRTKISEMGLGERVMIVTGCSEPSAYYKRADCCVLTSAYEGFPNVLLEANLQGCPVVVNQTKGGAREIITPLNGVYIEPGTPGGLLDFAAAITETCENPGKYDRAKIASQTKEMYGIEKTVTAYLKYIQDTIKIGPIKMSTINYKSDPLNVYPGNKPIADFLGNEEIANGDPQVIKSFGEEWQKFDSFDERDFHRLGEMYFDILPPELLNKESNVLDVGCGTGRWSKYLADKVGFIDCVDPSKAIFVADNLLKENNNVRLTKASTDTIPFDDNQFDMVMSIGVLHHIPDTLQAMKDCVKKVKPGGYFYTYLYYNFENRSLFYKGMFEVTHLLRKMVSSLPAKMKRIVCDILAVTVYMPFVLLSRFFYMIGMKKFSKWIVLSDYRDKSFHIIRNDSLDRFGTKLEQRFSKKDIEYMMTQSGVTNIVFSSKSPFWHAIGVKPK